MPRDDGAPRLPRRPRSRRACIGDARAAVLAARSRRGRCRTRAHGARRPRATADRPHGRNAGTVSRAGDVWTGRRGDRPTGFPVTRADRARAVRGGALDLARAVQGVVGRSRGRGRGSVGGDQMVTGRGAAPRYPQRVRRACRSRVSARALEQRSHVCRRCGVARRGQRAPVGPAVRPRRGQLSERGARELEHRQGARGCGASRRRVDAAADVHLLRVHGRRPSRLGAEPSGSPCCAPSRRSWRR